MVRAYLSSDTTNSDKDKVTENGDIPTTTITTTEEVSQNITAAKHFFNNSNPTKEFKSFKELVLCKYFSGMDSKAIDEYVQLEMKDREKGRTYFKARYKSLRERWMTPKKTPREKFSKSILHIERGQLIKLKQRNEKFRRKKQMEFNYRVRVVFEKYYNK